MRFTWDAYVLVLSNLIFKIINRVSMKYTLLVYMAFSIIFLFSCQKESQDSNVLPPINTTTGLLKSYTRIDTTIAAQNDTLFTVNYTYVILNSCTKILFKNFKNGI